MSSTKKTQVMSPYIRLSDSIKLRRSRTAHWQNSQCKSFSLNLHHHLYRESQSSSPETLWAAQKQYGQILHLVPAFQVWNLLTKNLHAAVLIMKSLCHMSTNQSWRLSCSMFYFAIWEISQSEEIFVGSCDKSSCTWSQCRSFSAFTGYSDTISWKLKTLLNNGYCPKMKHTIWNV